MNERTEKLIYNFIISLTRHFPSPETKFFDFLIRKGKKQKRNPNRKHCSVRDFLNSKLYLIITCVSVARGSFKIRSVFKFNSGGKKKTQKYEIITARKTDSRFHGKNQSRWTMIRRFRISWRKRFCVALAVLGEKISSSCTFAGH